MATISGHGVRIYVRHNADEQEPYRVMVKSLLEFVDWIGQVKLWPDARIRHNGMNGCTVITDSRYFVVVAE